MNVISTQTGFAQARASGRMKKWAVELGQFKVDFKQRVALKGQVMVDFSLEFPHKKGTFHERSSLSTRTIHKRGKARKVIILSLLVIIC